MTTRHVPVLLAEVLAAFGDVQGRLVADGTLGGGGHTGALLAAGATVVATDWDAAALARCAGLEEAFPGQFERHQVPFERLPEVLAGRQPQGILLDLGLSSDQLDDPARGLSYHAEGPLDMRLDSTRTLTAAEIVNTWREEELAALFRTHAEEPKARPLARALVARRKQAPLASTTELLAVIEALYPPRFGLKRAHPAARLFQALRVVVNDELGTLERALPALAATLAPGGVLAVITFQPAEERLVKQVFRQLAVTPLDEIGRVAGPAPYHMGKKIMAGEAELALNPRARSAILRTLKKHEPAHA